MARKMDVTHPFFNIPISSYGKTEARLEPCNEKIGATCSGDGNPGRSDVAWNSNMWIQINNTGAVQKVVDDLEDLDQTWRNNKF